MKKTVFLFFLLAGPFLPAHAQQKRVLLEKYTSAFCGACPNAHLIAEELAGAYPELSLAFHHSSVDGMANPNSMEWRDGFGVPGTPMGMVGRKGPDSGQIAVLPQLWEERILEQLHEPAYVGLELQGSYNPASRVLSLDVSCTFTERPPAGELRLNLMVTEDSVIHAGNGFDQSNYFNEVEGHALYGLGQPIYFYPHHHVVREIVDGTWGTTGVFPLQPEPGQVYPHHYDYFVPWNWDQEKIRLLVFVSLYNEQDLQQRQALNVAELPLYNLVATAAEEPNAEAQAFRVYPNPAVDRLQVELPPHTHRIVLHTLTGRAAYAREARSGLHEIDISGLPSGLYWVRAYTDKGSLARKASIHAR